MLLTAFFLLPFVAYASIIESDMTSVQKVMEAWSVPADVVANATDWLRTGKVCEQQNDDNIVLLTYDTLSVEFTFEYKGRKFHVDLGCNEAHTRISVIMLRPDYFDVYVDYPEYSMGGTFADELLLMDALEIVSCDFCNLEGVLPSSTLTALPRLIMLYFPYSRLTGALPTMPADNFLVEVDLAHNQLTGPFPTTYMAAELALLSIDDNQLTGTVPPITADVMVLNFEGNRFEGPIPPVAISHYAPFSCTIVLSDPNCIDNSGEGKVETNCFDCPDDVAAYIRDHDLDVCSDNLSEREASIELYCSDPRLRTPACNDKMAGVTSTSSTSTTATSRTTTSSTSSTTAATAAAAVPAPGASESSNVGVIVGVSVGVLCCCCIILAICLITGTLVARKRRQVQEEADAVARASARPKRLSRKPSHASTNRRPSTSRVRDR
jgi:hypothetical protein